MLPNGNARANYNNQPITRDTFYRHLTCNFDVAVSIRAIGRDCRPFLAALSEIAAENCVLCAFA